MHWSRVEKCIAYILHIAWFIVVRLSGLIYENICNIYHYCIMRRYHILNCILSVPYLFNFKLWVDVLGVTLLAQLQNRNFRVKQRMHMSYPRTYQNSISMPRRWSPSTSFNVIELPKNTISFRAFQSDKITSCQIRNKPPLILEKNARSK